MRKSYETSTKQYNEAREVLDAFLESNKTKYKSDSGYAYTAGYLMTLLSSVLANSASTEVFNNTMEQLRNAITKNAIESQS